MQERSAGGAKNDWLDMEAIWFLNFKTKKIGSDVSYF